MHALHLGPMDVKIVMPVQYVHTQGAVYLQPNGGYSNQACPNARAGAPGVGVSESVGAGSCGKRLHMMSQCNRRSLRPQLKLHSRFPGDWNWRSAQGTSWLWCSQQAVAWCGNMGMGTPQNCTCQHADCKYQTSR